ncbi:MAG: IS3 family transposase [Acidimicrobiia bacterium]|nr:IS3 family transposase [Acidimicrobiia bacterium]
MESSHTDPDPEVPVRARPPRSYSAKYKARILAEYEDLSKGDKGALLRREGLYSSLISEWRKQRDRGALEALSKSSGRPPADPLERENVRLVRENRRLETDLDKARRVIEVQGKPLGVVGAARHRQRHRDEGREAMIDEAIDELAPVVGVTGACLATGRPRSTHYRRHRQSPPPPKPERVPQLQPRALSEVERKEILRVLHEPDHVDEAPATVFAKLLDEATYLASVSTMYRILRAEGEVGDRRRHATHPAHKKPELIAVAPNDVWSWDITKLLGPHKWSYYYLYVIIDIYSRYVPGWMLADKENGRLAEQLLAETTAKQHIERDRLTIHADRGSPMVAKPVAHLLADLGVTKSHSRPHVSNDNPYSESQFRTLKYRPEFPERFGSIQDARSYCNWFFGWYNNQHRHSGIGFHTPADVHYGRAEAIQQQRAQVLNAAYAAHPERFVRKPPQPPALPTAAWINPPPDSEDNTTTQ